MKPRALFVAALALVLVPLWAPLAHAAFDPSTADSDVTTILKSGGYSFCENPPSPLPLRARRLCPLASEIPNCGALVTACDDKEPKVELSEFWKRVIAALVVLLPYLAWALIAVVVLSVLVLAVRALLGLREGDHTSKKKQPKLDVALVPDAPPDSLRLASLELFERAADARSRGAYREALALYLAAALRALDERGALRLAPHTTNGEYLRACRDTQARAPLRELVRGVDVVEFGGAQATAESASRAEAQAVRVVQASPSATTSTLMTMLVLGLVSGLVTGCGGVSHGRDDPSGKELLIDLLEKQGAKVSPLPVSLANLPMNGSNGPVVVLDVETVPLEDTTQEHLTRWVEQGGTLVLAGNAAKWPSELWAKPTGTELPDEPTVVTVKTRPAPKPGAAPKAKRARPEVRQATIAHPVAMTWPSDERAPRVVASLDDDGLYAALREVSEGRVLGLASNDLLTNAGLSVPHNAEALVAILGALDETEFSVVRPEQGVAPPPNPFAGLLAIGLGPALLQAALFALILYFAYGVRLSAPTPTSPPRRRAFAEHVEATGALYARTRSAAHALAVFTRFTDERLRARMPRGGEPGEFLAGEAGPEAKETYQRALAVDPRTVRRREAFQVLEALSRAVDRAKS
jgi:Domain of unknown function (DUF4129)